MSLDGYSLLDFASNVDRMGVMTRTPTEKQFDKLASALIDAFQVEEAWPEHLSPRNIATAFGRLADRANLVHDLPVWHAASVLEDVWMKHAEVRDEYLRVIAWTGSR
jgi:hypothetical protein